MEYRIEHDSMGEMKVPANALWGAQTQRSFENFKIGAEKMKPDILTIMTSRNSRFSTVNEAMANPNRTSLQAAQ